MGHTVDEDREGRRINAISDPADPFLVEIHVAQYVVDSPSSRCQKLFQIELDTHAWRARLPVDAMDKIVGKHDIMRDVPSRNESRLVWTCKRGHESFQAVDQNAGNHFVNFI